MADPLLARLQKQLADLEQDPSSPLNEHLFESSALVLPRQISADETVELVRQLAQQIPQLRQDPTAPINLLVTLLEPVSFSNILTLSPNIDFVAGLDTQAGPYNRLLLTLLRKASGNASDTATVASHPETVAALVRLWLGTSDTGTANQASDILINFLRTDQQVSLESASNGFIGQGQGLFWKRIFQDHDVYGAIYSACSFKSGNNSLNMTKSQKTLAQARLLEWLPQVGKLDWAAIRSSYNADIESQYVSGQQRSLLDFAVSDMVDTKEDVLMHKCLIDFYKDIITTVRQEDAQGHGVSVSLALLEQKGVHERSLSYFLDPDSRQHDPLDVQFLYGSSADYLSAYASAYSSHFMQSNVKDRALNRLRQSLDISSSRWAHQESPRYDLHVLASLPRMALIPRGTGPSAWTASPLSLIPSKATNPDVLQTLAAIFHGPSQAETITYPSNSPLSNNNDSHNRSEAQAARALYYLYLNNNPQLWSDLVAHAETVALKELALAAINVMAAVITAKWEPLGEDNTSDSLTESRFESLLPSPPTATPAQGVQAILAPPSLEHTLPYLLKPAQSFANLVGGRGDVESAAYKIAMAKFDVVKALHDRLEVVAQAEPGEGYEDILSTLRKTLARGPWSREGEVGGRIATMDL